MKKGIMSNGFRTGVCRRAVPPLTSADIITLHGKPAIRKTTKTAQGINDEWIYFNTNYEEHYFFKDEQLVRWERIPLLSFRPGRCYTPAVPLQRDTAGYRCPYPAKAGRAVYSP